MLATHSPGALAGATGAKIARRESYLDTTLGDGSPQRDPALP